VTLDTLLREHAVRQPGQAAILSAEGSIAYADLDQSVTCLARHLLDCGLQPGDRVAIRWCNSIEAAQLFLAVFRAGLIAVPVNLRLKPAEIAYIFEHSGARICFSEPTMAPLAETARSHGGPEIVNQLPVLTGGATLLSRIDPGQPALILYTSGTMARGKGVIHTHRSLLECGRLMSPDLIGPADIVLIATQLAHSSGLNVGLVSALAQGTTAVMLKAFEPAACLDLVERFRCTYFLALPAMLQFICNEQARSPRDVSSLRTVASGGDTVPIALQERFQQLFGANIFEGYGMTETVPVAFNRSAASRTGSVGQAVSGISVRLVDSDGRDVAPGETGEIIVQSPANCAGYWEDPAATDALFTKDSFDKNWLRTGDLATRDSDGYLWFKGRLKQLIIRGGCNISPQEVEEALYQHPAVLEAGVVGLPHPIYGELPAAFVSLRAGQFAEEDALRAHARELLSDYKVPERVFFLDELPKGLTGKVDRRRLRDILITQPQLLEQHVEARV
jgi:long-chain acyl-CoA synthetase